METIKETDDEENELHEGQTLINSNMVKTLEDLGKPLNGQNLTRKSTFPRNFSTMSFVPRKRRDSKDTLSLVSSYSRLDFTGSSLYLHLDVSIK